MWFALNLNFEVSTLLNFLHFDGLLKHDWCICESIVLEVLYFVFNVLIIPFVALLFWYILKPVIADAIPSRRAMVLQISVAMKAMPWYSLLPTISEYLTELGWTKSFPRLHNVGWLSYVVYLAIYMVIVEFGIYWMHRELHDIKPLYKHLHATHHIYNKQNTLSPFAG